MNEGNKTPRKLEESPKTVAATPAVKPSGWKRLLSRRWVFPAVYMAAAAIIVTILWVSGAGRNDADNAVPGTAEVASETAGTTDTSEDAATAMANGETLQWPVANFADMTTIVPFYDASASLEDREAAMVEYNNTFTPHMATDLARKDAAPFEVLAALGGKVTVASQTPANGYEVQIEHPNGLVTVYQSLTDLQVAVGDEVAQGDPIATAGSSEAEPSEGAHVHFEVRSNGLSVNPATLINEE